MDLEIDNPIKKARFVSYFPGFIEALKKIYQYNTVKVYFKRKIKT